MKGGRYDRLLEQFGKDAPAVGFVMVVDSILEALSRQGVAMPDAGEIRRISYSREDFPEKLAEAQRLRSQGIAAALVPAGSGCCAPEDCCQEGGIGHE